MVSNVRSPATSPRKVPPLAQSVKVSTLSLSFHFTSYITCNSKLSGKTISSADVSVYHEPTTGGATSQKSDAMRNNFRAQLNYDCESPVIENQWSESDRGPFVVPGEIERVVGNDGIGGSYCPGVAFALEGKFAGWSWEACCMASHDVQNEKRSQKSNQPARVTRPRHQPHRANRRK